MKTFDEWKRDQSDEAAFIAKLSLAIILIIFVIAALAA